MKVITIPFFDVELSLENPTGNIVELLKLVKPEWPTEHIQIETMTRGNVNVMMCCHLATDQEKSDAIMVRIHGPHHLEWFNRDTEVAGMVLGHEAGCNQPILAIFKNGFVIGYAQGHNIAVTDTANPKIAKAAARAIAKFKLMDVDQYRVQDTAGHQYQIPKEMRNIITARAKLHNIPEANFHLVPGIPSRQTMLEEIDKIEEKLTQSSIPVMLCHNDYHTRNTIYNETSDTVNIVDFEHVCFCYEPMDLGFMLIGNEFFEGLKWCSPNVPPLTNEVVLMWIRFYLEAKADIKCENDAGVTDAQIQQFHRDLKKCLNLWYFRTTIICLMFSGGATLSQDDCEFHSVALLTWKLYLENKKDLFDS